jgi:hypothetical protein
MSVKKIIILAVAVVFLATPAIADNQPEFEAVGCDATNLFAVDGELTYDAVTENCEAEGFLYNKYSDWEAYDRSEFFTPPAGKQARTDFCFGHPSWRTEPQFPATYVWQFKLQMSPESDINVNIYDCVLKPQGTDIFTEAQQTGRENLTDGSTRFFRSQNPRITAMAYAVDGRFDPFYLRARKMPNLGRVCLNNRLYTSKAHWEEGLVLALPIEGRNNLCEGTEHQLMAGDFIRVTVNVPPMHPARLAYGKENVLLKYIGIVGTELVVGGFPIGGGTPVPCEIDG